MRIQVIGGTYREYILESNSNRIYGSGLRGVCYLLGSTDFQIDFYTIANPKTEKFLDQYKKEYKERINIKCKHSNNDNLISFKYLYELDEPEISAYEENSETLSIDGENVIYFGMLESQPTIKGKKVVYDPQNGISSLDFTSNSKNVANELVYILNRNESKVISSCENDEDIVKYFFKQKNVKGLIIKDGPNGAYLYTPDLIKVHIPAYQTNNVFKMGSGDIFTSAFARFWFDGYELEKAAINSSKTVSLYCNYNNCTQLPLSVLDKFSFPKKNIVAKEIATKKIYIAGPLFSVSDIAIIDKLKKTFEGLGISVFSPFHDVGYGDDVSIAKKDIEGIDNCDIIFAILDGLDSGTLIELGYAMSKGIKIIGYHRTVKEENLLMLKPAQIQYYNHLTTAIYQTIWNI